MIKYYFHYNEKSMFHLNHMYTFTTNKTCKVKKDTGKIVDTQSLHVYALVEVGPKLTKVIL